MVRIPKEASIHLLSVVCALAATQVHSQESTGERPDVHHDIEEIIVEATALPRTVEELSQPTAVLRGDELAKKSASSIGETVSGELGVSSTYFGPVASRPVIRGQFGERIQVLTNGLDALDASALSDDHQTSIDGLLADRIEIIRGPATLLYGSGAAGGLINVVDNRIVSSPYDDSFTGKVAVSGDTAVGERAGGGWLAFGSDRFAVHLDYFRRETDEVEIPGFAESARLRALEEEEHDHEEEEHEEHEEEEEAFGHIENSDSETDGGAVALTWFADNGYIGASFSGFDSDYGVPGGHGHGHEEEEHEEGEEEEHEEEEEEIVRIGLEQQRFDLKGQFAFDSAIEGLRFRFSANDYEHTEFEGDEVGTVFETDGIDGRIELRHRPLNGFEGAFGVQLKRIDFNAVGDEAYVPPSDLRQSSFFLFEELPINDRFVLQGSMRIETQSIDGSTLAVDYDETGVSFGLGAVASFSNDWSLAAHYSRSERHPTPTELYADGPHVAVQRFERGSVTLGNGLLDKEISNNIDLTLRGNTERVDWTFTAFMNTADDYVVLSPTAEEEDEFIVYEYGQVDAEFYGFEAEARIELLDLPRGHLHTRLFTDYVHGEQRQSGAYLPRLPPLRFGAGLHYTMDEFEISVDATAYEKQGKTAANELPTDSYVLLGAEVSYATADPGLFLFLRGSNLGDEDARQHASPLKDMLPLPGRSLHAGIRWEF